MTFEVQLHGYAYIALEFCKNVHSVVKQTGRKDVMIIMYKVHVSTHRLYIWGLKGNGN
jgi:hypothetical protein